MSEMLETLAAHCREAFGELITASIIERGELTVEIKREHVSGVCRLLRDHPRLAFEQLIDLCGVDYLSYRKEAGPDAHAASKAHPSRFAVVYHLLSVRHNQRLRLRVYLEDEMPLVASVNEIWASANWFEREAFDLFGIVFEGHPDLRRILTDYG